MAGRLKKFFSTPVEKSLNRHPAFLPSFCCLTLVLSNGFLEYGKLNLAAKTWIVLFGILTPVLLAFFTLKGPDTLTKEFLPPVPTWILGVVMAAAVFLRLFRLTSLSTWPISDEGISGYFATLLGEKWDWALIQCPEQIPTSYFWGLSIFFKAFGHSLATLWLFPAFCSIACVPVAWLACRTLLPFSMAFLTACWITFSFWPLYDGRFSILGIWMILWELLAFWALARYLTAIKKPGGKGPIYALAVLVGAGFYTYLAWPFVALVITLTLAASNSSKPLPRRLGILFKFLVVVALFLFPLFLAYLREYRGYFHHLWAFSAPHPFLDRLSLPLSCLSDLFWGAPQKFFHFGPIWGGFLNPFSTTLFFWGLIHLLHHYRKLFSLWIFMALFISFLPAILTNNFEITRLISMLPLLVLVCAVGTQFFLSRIPAGKRMIAFFLVLSGSTSFDLFHLLYVYPRDFEKNVSYYEGAKSPEFYKAYSLLKPISEKEGPGLILLNFHPDPYDQTLFVATYDFNAAENPNLDPAKAEWAGVLTNIHEEPFFKIMFPEGKWVWLSEGLNRRDGGFILEMIPVTQSNNALLDRWAQADLSLKGLTNLVMKFGVDPDQNQMMAVLRKAYPYFKGDPLLESRYWRIMALHHAAAGRVDEAVEDEKKAIAKGLPMAHLYNDMGCLLFKEKNLGGAQKAFEGALRLKLNLTDAGSNLKNILLLKKPNP